MNDGMLAPLVGYMRGVMMRRKFCLGHGIGAQCAVKLRDILKVKALKVKGR